MFNKEKKNKKKCTYVGGQAVLEGVMMMGQNEYGDSRARPRRRSAGRSKRIKKGKHLSMALKIPFVRGTVNLVLSLIRGTKTLLRSAAVYGEDEEEEPGKIQKWLAEKCKVNLMDVISVISACLGVVLAVGIFIFFAALFDFAYSARPENGVGIRASGLVQAHNIYRIFILNSFIKGYTKAVHVPRRRA